MREMPWCDYSLVSSISDNFYFKLQFCMFTKFNWLMTSILDQSSKRLSSSLIWSNEGDDKRFYSWVISVDSVIFYDSLEWGNRFDIFSWPPIETTGYVDVNTLGLLFLGSVVLLSKGSRLSEDKLKFL